MRHRLLFALTALLFGIWFYQCLPEPLFNAPYSSVLLSREGKLMGAHIANDEQWRFPPVKQVPKKFAASLIAFEDKRFYRHPGVDPLALARAIRLNVQHGRIVSGASTLSMQVIRLSQHNPPRTLWNKILEALKAIRLETRFTKDQILNLYASHAPFGGNVVGLEAASWRYFGRAADRLSWAESAMLAVLPNSPGLIHVGRSRQRLKAKRDKLLLTLKTHDVISELDYTLAVAEPLPLKPEPLPRLAPHLLDTLILKHQRYSPSQAPRFHTSLAYNTQRAALQIARHHGETLALRGVNNLAMLVIDNKTFEVLAYIGNAPSDRANQFGHAIDLIPRPRSTGSTLKPFLFASMIQQGELLPETLVADTPVRYSGYRPKNFNRDFRGAVPARSALASSLNIPAVNMLSYHGVERFLDTLKKMGLTHLHRNARDYGLPLILGGAEASLWELTNLYANLAFIAQQHHASDWRFYRQATLDGIVQSQSDNPSDAKAQLTKTHRINTISPPAAWMTLQSLLEVTRPGSAGYWKRFNSTHKIAWKTGTSFGHRDAWAIGTTPQYTVGVWIGNASGEGRPGVTGVQLAAPMMFDMFNRLNLDDSWFEKPSAQMKTVNICKDDGFLANELCESKPYDIPQSSHFERISPNHQRIHVVGEDDHVKRVHSGCESISNMQTRHWFVLPPDQAFYYQRFNANYQALPDWREDCEVMLDVSESLSENPISLIYPRQNTQVYIPKDLANERSKVVFKAVHRTPSTQIFWHLDNTFLGTTQDIHQQAIWVHAGKHEITLVDEKGQRVSRQFEVLSE
ncbi:MAG: penicillin-binding protein 1C [Proteobacteria bacterium]|nr:MAG: penicillin-binding protein 1C [Pseudomonadota bacterium]